MLVIDQIRDLCRQEPLRAKWVVVPSRAMGHTLGDRLAIEGLAWANLRVRTPRDLALDAAGPALLASGRSVLPSAEGPTIVMRLLADLPPDVPAYFRALATDWRMASVLWSAITDLRLAGIDCATFDTAAIGRAEKGAELEALLGAYETWLARNQRVDAAGLLREATANAAQAGVRPGDLMLVWPSHAWSRFERMWLDSLPAERVAPRVARSMGVARPARLGHGDVELVRSTGFRWGPLAIDDEVAGARAGASAPPVAEPPAIDCFRAGSRGSEIEEVFRRIAKLGVRLDAVEVATVAADAAGLVWERATALGWPVTIDAGVPVERTGPGEALLGWTRWVEAGLTADGLRHLLDARLIGPRRGEGPHGVRAAWWIARAEATWGAASLVRSLDELTEQRRARASRESAGDVDQAAARDEVEQLATWVRELVTLDAGFDAEVVEVASVANAAQRLVDEFAVVPDETQASRSERARIDRLAAHALSERLAACGVLGAWRTSPGEALAFVRDLVATLSVGGRRARPGHLHVTSLSSAGLAGRRTTFVVGVEEGRLVPALIEDPVLLDAERVRLSSDLQTSHDRAAEAVFHVVERLSAIEGRVTLSFSCRDLREARPLLPSWLLLQSVRLAARDATLGYDCVDERLGAAVTEVPAAPSEAIDAGGWWLATLRHGGFDRATARALVEAAYPGLAHGRRADAERATPVLTPWDGYVPEAGAMLDPRGGHHILSATRLESFAACPYRYFLEYGLGLRHFEPAEPTLDRWLDPATRGSLLHAIYADVLRRVRDRKRPLSLPADREWVRALADEELAQVREEIPPPAPEVFARERNEVMAEVDVFLAGEVADPHRTPVALEVGFGLPPGEDDEPLGSATPCAIPLRGGRAISLRGRIDRVDRLPSGAYEIVDYKTGYFREADWTGRFRGGRMLQHALYGLAAASLLATTDPAARVELGTYYFSTRRGRRRRVRIAAPPRTVITTLLDRLCDVAAAGAFVHTTDEGDCRYCVFESACHKNHARAASKVDMDPTLAPFAEVRGHE